MARHDLRLGLDLELAQLAARPLHGLLEFFDVKLNGIELLIEP